jgi:hypothetical protein
MDQSWIIEAAQRSIPRPSNPGLTPPDRVTLAPPALSFCTPFDHYKATAAQEEPPYKYRFVIKKLGLTRAEFEDRIAEEVDELLGAEVAQRRDNIPLTKEDCLQHFRNTGFPPEGPLMGVYRWAADLGISRYNFDEDPTPENILLLADY